MAKLKTQTDYRQLSMSSALEELEFELLVQSRKLTASRPRSAGPVDKKGNPRKGLRMAVCAHPNCGGVRSTWNWRGLRICARDWRVRRRIFALLAAGVARRAAGARGSAM